MTGYQIKLETLDVAGLAMQVRSLLDKQQFHDPEGEAERIGISSAAWPLFGLVWPSALVLAAHLQDAVLGERRIPGVGWGLGLAPGGRLLDFANFLLRLKICQFTRRGRPRAGRHMGPRGFTLSPPANIPTRPVFSGQRSKRQP